MQIIFVLCYVEVKTCREELCGKLERFYYERLKTRLTKSILRNVFQKYNAFSKKQFEIFLFRKIF